MWGKSTQAPPNRWPQHILVPSQTCETPEAGVAGELGSSGDPGLDVEAKWGLVGPRVLKTVCEALDEQEDQGGRQFPTLGR